MRNQWFWPLPMVRKIVAQSVSDSWAWVTSPQYPGVPTGVHTNIAGIAGCSSIHCPRLSQESQVLSS